MSKEQNFQFSPNVVIITYDLRNNDISASEIAQESNGLLFTCFSVGGLSYDLPTTTLYMQNGNRVTATKIFENAFNKAKANKLYSRASIKNVLVLEVGKKNGFVFNSQ